MNSNTNNLQSFVCEVIMYLGQNNAVILWRFFSVFFILLLFTLSICSSTFLQKKLKHPYSFINHRYTFYVAMGLTILILRFPHLSRSELNVDESQWIASAITLLDDGRFWLSVDNATSGPLVSAPLILIKLFGASINYGTVKLFALFIWIASFIFIYKALRIFSDEMSSRFALTPAVICVASFTFSDYVTYNSEHVPIVLLSVCIFLSTLIQIRKEHIQAFHVIVLGLLLGCIPYSKLQTVPTALCIALFTLFFLNKKHLFPYILAGLIPSISVLTYLLITGIFQDFWTSYIMNNLHFAKVGIGHNLSLFKKISLFPEYVTDITDTNYFFFFYILLSFCLLVFILINLRKQIMKKEYYLIIFALLLPISALYSIVQSGNFFFHYNLLLIIPLTFLFGTLLSSLYSKASSMYLFKPKSYLIVSGIILSISIIINYKSRNMQVFAEALANYKLAQEVSKVSESILQMASRNDKMSIWGWACNYFVETQLPQGNRDGHTLYQTNKGPFQEYYLNRYTQDILRNKPAFFINAVSDKHFAFTDTLTQSYNRYPAIKQVIDSLYTYVGEVEGAKVFVLKNKKLDFNNKAQKVD